MEKKKTTHERIPIPNKWKFKYGLALFVLSLTHFHILPVAERGFSLRGTKYEEAIGGSRSTIYISNNFDYV